MKISAIVVLLFLFFVGSVKAQDRYVFFGDSLVDNQNSYLFTTRLLGSSIPATPPYYDGRFSNGPNWTDVVAPTQLYYGEYFFGTDSGPQPDVSMNFAFGGSRSGSEVLPMAPGFLTVLGDLGAYNNQGRVADVSDSIAVVWTGGNDYSAYTFNYISSGGSTSHDVVGQTVGNIGQGLNQLSGMGVRRAVVFNQFDLSRIPTFISTLGTTGANLAGDLATQHNVALPGMIDSVRAQTGMDIILVDIHALYEDFFTNPTRYGFTNLNQGCIDETTLQRTGACLTAASETAFLFWDGTHPTAAAHAYIAELFNATVQTVDQSGGQIAALPDSSIVLVDTTSFGVRSRLDAWKAKNGVGGAEFDRGKFNLYAIGGNSLGNRAPTDSFAGYDYRTMGAIIGGDRQPLGGDHPFLFGGYVNLLELESEITSGGSFENRAYGAGLYGGIRLGDHSLVGRVASTYFHVANMSRATGFTTLPTAGAETTGYALSGELEWQYDHETAMSGNPLIVSPFARLSAVKVDMDGYTEHGAEFMNLTVDGTTATNVRSALGVSIRGEIHTDSGMVVGPFATLSWERNLMESDMDISATLNSGQRISTTAIPSDQDAIMINAGMRLDLEDGMQVEATFAAKYNTMSGNSYVIPRVRFQKSF